MRRVRLSCRARKFLQVDNVARCVSVCVCVCVCVCVHAPDSTAVAVSRLKGVFSMITTAVSSFPSNFPSTHIILLRELSFRTLKRDGSLSQGHCCKPSSILQQIRRSTQRTTSASNLSCVAKSILGPGVFDQYRQSGFDRFKTATPPLRSELRNCFTQEEP